MLYCVIIYNTLSKVTVIPERQHYASLNPYVVWQWPGLRDNYNRWRVSWWDIGGGQAAAGGVWRGQDCESQTVQKFIMWGCPRLTFAHVAFRGYSICSSLLWKSMRAADSLQTILTGSLLCDGLDCEKLARYHMHWNWSHIYYKIKWSCLNYLGRLSSLSVYQYQIT